jgi:hypothetical protein
MDLAYLLIAGSVQEDTSVQMTRLLPLIKFKFALKATTALRELNRPLSVPLDSTVLREPTYLFLAQLVTTVPQLVFTLLCALVVAMQATTAL